MPTHSLEPELAAVTSDVQRSIAAELIASHTRQGDAAVGFVLLATVIASALADVEHEAMQRSLLTGFNSQVLIES